MAVHESNMRAFAALDRSRGQAYPMPAGDLRKGLFRLRRLLATDPGGAWVAERGGEVVGGPLALLREGLWGLSLLFTDPSAQGEGIGRELLARAWAYGVGARGRLILSSVDPRLGLAMHPSVAAMGVCRGSQRPSAGPSRCASKPAWSCTRTRAACSWAATSGPSTRTPLAGHTSRVSFLTQCRF